MSNAALLEISDTEQFATNLVKSLGTSQDLERVTSLGVLHACQTNKIHCVHIATTGHLPAARARGVAAHANGKAKLEKTSAETFQSALPITYEKVT